MRHSALETIAITVKSDKLNFRTVRDKAEESVSELLAEPMLIAWFDGKKGEEHPCVPECQHKPGWLAYAMGHGGQVRVDVNKGDYSFIFSDTKLD